MSPIVSSLALASIAVQTATAPTPATPTPPQFAKSRLAAPGYFPAPRIPLIADFDGDGSGDLIAVNQHGALDVALGVRNGKPAAPFSIQLPAGTAAESSVTDAWVERDSTSKKLTLRIRRTDRIELRGTIEGPGSGRLERAEGAAAGERVGFVSPPVAPNAPLQADFDGDGAADTLTEGRLVCTSAPQSPVDVPELRTFPQTSLFFACDFNGDSRADLGVIRRDGEWRRGADVLVLLSYRPADTDPDADGLDTAAERAAGSDPLDADTDHDGLLDGWEVKGEGSLDLPALGASPTHKDCVVFVQRAADTNGAHCGREIDRAVRTWAELPNKNLDGKTGINLHVLWLPTLPPAEMRPWWELGAAKIPADARGLAHYMILSRGGGGQAADLGDAGGCGQDALWACFLHEFGHQVGLTHSGGALPGLCPTYTSLMSYAYSYGFEDDGARIHYSRGDLAGLVLNEQRLPERVELPADKLQFLSKGPYRFKLERDGDATKVDWNRDGQFASSPVRADITDVYGANPGYRHPVGKTIQAPTLASHDGRLVLAAVNHGKKLFVRSCEKEGAWTEERALEGIAPTGDPWLLSHKSDLWLFVPTAEGIRALRAAAADGLAAERSELLPDSAGCAVSAVSFGGAPYTLLWRGPQQPVRVTTHREGAWTAPRDLAGLLSEMPPGATESLDGSTLLVGTGRVLHAGGVKRQWILTTLKLAADGGFVVSEERIVGGEKAGWHGNSRPVLILERGADAVAQGRLHFVARGWCDPVDSNGCYWEAITIGDRAQDDGWRLRRFNDEWTTTKSPVAAAWHAGDLVVAYRWFGNVHGDEDDNLHVAHHALGIDPDDLRDYDDVSAIADLGLERSIPWRSQGQR